MQHQQEGSLIVAGDNYGQGSSREHAAIAPRFLGVRAVIAKGFARIHWQNLCNFGILPLTFADPQTWEKVDQGDVLALPDIRSRLQAGRSVQVTNKTKGFTFEVEHTMTERQLKMVLSGSLLNLMH
jgi:aconitate hydratase